MMRPGETAAPAPAAGTSATVSADVRKALVGRWLRTDGGYVMAITSVGEDGRVVAMYSNPRPINVAKAQVTQDGRKTALYVELRDRGYPGSYYTLNYDPASDQFAGVYHHLGINENFDVRFERLGKEANGNQ
jgi:hypothetical protein